MLEPEPLPFLARWYAWGRAHPYLSFVAAVVLYLAVAIGCLLLSPSLPLYVSVGIAAVCIHTLHWASIHSWQQWLRRAILHVAGQAGPARSAEVFGHVPAPTKEVRREIDWLLARGRLTTDPGSGRLVAT